MTESWLSKFVRSLAPKINNNNYYDYYLTIFESQSRFGFSIRACLNIE